MEIGSSSTYTRDHAVDVFGRRSLQASSGQWKASSFVLVNQGLVSITYYGVYNNLARYLTNVFHEGNAAAANHVNAWTGTSSITALVGGFISDSYLGRFWTIVVFLILYLASMVLLNLSAAISSLRPPSCDTGNSTCKKAEVGQSAFLYFSLYLGALAAGAYQPCSSSMGADQFDEDAPSEMKKKPAYFNWFYLSMNIGALIASTIVLYIQENVSWSWGLGICTITMGLSLLIFICGSLFYRNHRPGGNPLVRMLQVFVSAFSKRNAELPVESGMLYELGPDKMINCGSRKIRHTDKFRFLDKAAIIDEADRSETGPWRLCTVTQVEELKCIIRMVPIFVSSIIYSVVYSQMATFFLEQGGTMDTSIGGFRIPPGSLSVFENLSIILWTPAYELLMVPLFRKLTSHHKGITDLQRVGTGLVIGMLAMVAAALVEVKRLKVARAQDMLDSQDALPKPTPRPLNVVITMAMAKLEG